MHGGRVQLNVKVATDARGLRGLFATEHVPKGGILATVPASVVINLGVGAASHAECCRMRTTGTGEVHGDLTPHASSLLSPGSTTAILPEVRHCGYTHRIISCSHDMLMH